MKPCLVMRFTWALTGIALCVPAWAGRPLTVEDAATAEQGTCQLEVWTDQASDQRTQQWAPACGVAAGVEVALSGAQLHSSQPRRQQAGGSVKIVPSAWQTEVSWGPWSGTLQWGLKAETLYNRGQSAAGASSNLGWAPSWQWAQTQVLAVASWRADAHWAAHANVGLQRIEGSPATARLIRLAGVWTPRPDMQWFAEALANHRPEVFGPHAVALGGRWWWIQDRLGLDLVATRERGASAPRVGVGLGWYALGW
jgi:hypothetical protein